MSAIAPIYSVSVPHHVKVAGKVTYACRVVPSPDPQDASEKQSKSLRSTEVPLGRMPLAGTGKFAYREPYTVFRSWDQFLDFSNRLAVEFPVISEGSNNNSNLPLAFYRETPRLSRKLSLFVTRSTLLQRQEELDLFCRRLFEMPEIVTQSNNVIEFFRVSSDQQPISISTDVPTPTDELTPTAKMKRHARLGLKSSTPDLRKMMAMSDMSDLERPVLERGESRQSNYSIDTSSSCSSLATVTPSSLGLPCEVIPPVPQLPSATSRKPSPLSAGPAVFFPDFKTSETLDLTLQDYTPVSPPPPPRTKKHSLRQFRSLQDLRGHKNPSDFNFSQAPPLPIPSAETADMIRTSSQPPSSVNKRSHRRKSSGGSANSQVPARRRADSKSSVMSVEPTESKQSFLGRLTRPRTLSTKTTSPASSKLRRDSRGHSPSASSCSFTSSSNGSSRQSSGTSNSWTSRRSSVTAYSDAFLQTLQNTSTPSSPVEGSKSFFRSEEGVLVYNNNVPLPPFFPVPPSTPSPALRSRTSIDGTGLPDTPLHSPPIPEHNMTYFAIPSTPGPTSPAVSCKSAQTPRAVDPINVTFKVFHPVSNVMVRAPREALTLEKTRELIEKKLLDSCNVVLPNGTQAWKLVYEMRRRSEGGAIDPSGRGIQVLETEREFDAFMTETRDIPRVSLRILMTTLIGDDY